MVIDEIFMRRALQLARRGLGFTSPNPMVGAVIVGPDGRVIGEGYHRRWGEAHAEVNAVNSVADKSLLSDSTIYVTLEPCSHYGKTPPCAKLLIDCKIQRVVVGAVDPFEKVSGRGIEMLRQSGAEVVSGVLAQESRSLNAMFFTSHTHRRPFVALKFARSADGFIDCRRHAPDSPALTLSNSLSLVAMHRFRSLFDAILVGSGTLIADQPTLSVRLWDGRSPRPVVLDRRGRVTAEMLAPMSERNPLVVNDCDDVTELVQRLYSEHGVTSLLVEGGEHVLRSFLQTGMWDIVREEVAEDILVGDVGTAKAPIELLPYSKLVATERYGRNLVNFYSQNDLFSVKNI